jgi:hypothetical protein
MVDRSVHRRTSVVLAALRRIKPDSVVCVDCDGAETVVAISGQRGRYERAARSIVALNATTARCINAEGTVAEVLVVDPDADATTESTSESSAAAKLAKRVDEVTVLVKVALDAADRATQRIIDSNKDSNEALTRAVDTALSVLKVTADRAERLELLVGRLTGKRERELAEAYRELSRLPAGGKTADDSDGADDEADKKAEALLDKLIGMAMDKSSPKHPA